MALRSLNMYAFYTFICVHLSVSLGVSFCLLSRIASGSSQSVYLQFLATRSGLHPLPPVLLVDRKTNKKVLARGGQVLVTQ